MKLAEALLQRADYQKRVQQLRERLVRCAKVQEGETPPENPAELFKELDTITTQLRELVQRINRTNCVTKIDKYGTIADTLALRESIMLKRGILQAVIDAAALPEQRYSRAEIKMIATVNVRDLQKQADDLAKSFREVDTAIQQANWLTDLA